MRICVDALLGRRDADEPEHLDRDRARLGLRLALVQPHCLADLIADRVHGIERRHRLLEDHRDPVAADRAHLVEADREQVLARVLDRAAGDPARRARDEPHDRERGHRLAAAGLADDAERAARGDLERHAVDGADHAAIGGELRHQVADLEHWRSHCRDLTRSI
jgi:hypothetical protein